MPAAAVIPAPQVYIAIAAVKKLVVGSACSGPGPPSGCELGSEANTAGFLLMLFIGCLGWLASLL